MCGAGINKMLTTVSAVLFLSIKLRDYHSKVHMSVCGVWSVLPFIIQDHINTWDTYQCESWPWMQKLSEGKKLPRLDIHKEFWKYQREHIGNVFWIELSKLASLLQPHDSLKQMYEETNEDIDDIQHHSNTRLECHSNNSLTADNTRQCVVEQIASTHHPNQHPNSIHHQELIEWWIINRVKWSVGSYELFITFDSK